MAEALAAGPEAYKALIASAPEKYERGKREEVFIEEAVALIDEYSAGIPRKINNICDTALVIGFSRKLERIDADWIKRLIQTESGDGT